MAAMRDPARDWTTWAACRGVDPDLFLPRESSTGAFLKPPVEQALAYCEVCPVVAECAAEADETGDVGVWGGRYRPDKESSLHRNKAMIRRRARARG